MNSTAAPPRAPLPALPVEANSGSELLSATHLFTLRVLSVQAAPWATGQDGLEHRTLALQARLVDLFKGQFSLGPGQPFSVKIEQTRENELVGNDYHGLWSHVSPQPAPDLVYFVVSSSGTTPAEPASLLQDPACKALLPPGLASDETLAQQGEQLFQRALTTAGDGHPQLDAASQLLRFASDHSSEAADLFARYLWYRILPVVLQENPGIRAELLGLLVSPAASPAFRLDILVNVERVLPDLQQGDPGFTILAGRAIASLLLLPAAKNVHERVVSVSLYNIVFQDDPNARVTAAEIVPDPADRAKIANVLRASSSPNAQKLLAWLEH